MSKREKARAQVGSMLDPGEPIAALAHARLTMVGAAKRAAWVVVTDRRLLVLRDGHDTERVLVGEVLYEARRLDVSLSVVTGSPRHVAMADAASGGVVGHLDFGRHRSRAGAVVEAAAPSNPAEGTAPGSNDNDRVASLRPGERLPDGRVLSASEWLRAVLEGSGGYR